MLQIQSFEHLLSPQTVLVGENVDFLGNLRPNIEANSSN
jgi:hypothetical protein